MCLKCDCLKWVCERTIPHFIMWCILVLDRRVSSPLIMTSSGVVGRKRFQPAFLWNLSSSFLFSSTLARLSILILVVFQREPQHCYHHLHFPISCNGWMDGFFSRCFLFTEASCTHILVGWTSWLDGSLTVSVC